MTDVLLFQPSVESNTGLYYSAISNGLVALGMYLKSQSVDPQQSLLGVHHRRFSLEDEVLEQSHELAKIVTEMKK